MANYLLDHVQDRERGRWDDLRFPASGINPPGGVSDPDRDSTTGNCSLVEFDIHYQIDSFGSVDEYPVGV